MSNFPMTPWTWTPIYHEPRDPNNDADAIHIYDAEDTYVASVDCREGISLKEMENIAAMIVCSVNAMMEMCRAQREAERHIYD